MNKYIRYLVILFLIDFLSGCSTSYYLQDGYKKNVEEADESEIEYRILLIGDAGEPSDNKWEPVLRAMEDRAALLPHKTINLFLGDNVYSNGFNPGSDTENEIPIKRMEEQIKVIKNSQSKGIFIPGNHDWGDGMSNGWERIRNEEKYIDKYEPRIQFLPQDGCPGPEYKDYGNVLRIIFIDTQWWLQPDNYKPDSSNCDCYPVTKEGIINNIDSLIRTAGDKNIIIAAHHPLNTYGEHGGFFDWKAHIFPLRALNRFLWIPFPVIGSLYPLVRASGFYPQDTANDLYKDFIERMEKVISKYHKVIYTSGHEHSLQVLKGVNDNIYLISGFGTSLHINSLSYGDKSILSAHSPGFMQLDFLYDGKIRLSVYTVSDEYISTEAFSMWMFEQ
jgi:Calcineurin-like phosphoesterase